jgi:hypothetical protein
MPGNKRTVAGCLARSIKDRARFCSRCTGTLVRYF